MRNKKNPTHLRRAARTIQQLTGLNYQEALNRLRAAEELPNLNDPASVMAFANATNRSAVPTAEPSIVAELVELAERLGIDPSALDVDVHDAKGSEAADINNDGIEAQRKYLGIPHDAATDPEDDVWYQLLDEVHDAKGSEAADINNGGLPAQIEYLLQGNGSDAVRRRLLTGSWQFVLTLTPTGEAVCNMCGDVGGRAGVCERDLSEELGHDPGTTVCTGQKFMPPAQAGVCDSCSKPVYVEVDGHYRHFGTDDSHCHPESLDIDEETHLRIGCGDHCLPWATVADTAEAPEDPRDESQFDHRFNDAPFCAKCSGPCTMPRS